MKAKNQTEFEAINSVVTQLSKFDKLTGGNPKQYLSGKYLYPEEDLHQGFNDELASLQIAFKDLIDSRGEDQYQSN